MMQETQDNAAKYKKMLEKLAFNKILLIAPLTPKSQLWVRFPPGVPDKQQSHSNCGWLCFSLFYFYFVL